MSRMNFLRNAENVLDLAWNLAFPRKIGGRYIAIPVIRARYFARSYPR